MDMQPENRQLKIAKAIKALTFVFQIALSVLCPVLILIFIGIRLDYRYGNGNHWFTLLGSILGVYSAYRSTYLLIKSNFLKKEEKPAATDQNDGEWSMSDKKE